MSAFTVWNPHLPPQFPGASSNQRLVFDVTNGDVTDGIFDDREFLSAVLSELGVHSSIAEWKVRPFRTRYFSEYLDSDEWYGIWPVAWNFVVVGDEPFEELPRLGKPWLGTNAFGDELVDPPFENEPAACVVLADFDDTDARDAALASCILEELRVEHQAQPAESAKSVAYQKFPQLRVTLGVFNPDFYESGATYALAIEAALERLGGTTHHEKRL